MTVHNAYTRPSPLSSSDVFDISLLVYGPTDDPSKPSPSEPSFAYLLRHVAPQFNKRPFLSLQVLPSHELLLSLSESITFHRLLKLKTFAVLTKARGANACCNGRRVFLCFAKQKKFCIFHHDGSHGFFEVKEFGFYDTIRSMASCRENLCLCIMGEYMIMNSSNGALSVVFPCGRLALPQVVQLPFGELILWKALIC